MSEVQFDVVTIDEENNIKKVIINGTLDAHTIPNFEDLMNQLVEDNNTKLLVDCANLKFISSAGLGVFMATLEDIEDTDEDGFLKLFGLIPDVYDVFDMLGFTAAMEFYDNEEEAINSI